MKGESNLASIWNSFIFDLRSLRLSHPIIFTASFYCFMLNTFSINPLPPSPRIPFSMYNPLASSSCTIACSFDMGWFSYALISSISSSRTW